MKRTLFRIVGVLLGTGIGAGVALAMFSGLTSLIAPNGTRIDCIANCGIEPEWADCTVWSPPAEATIRYTQIGAYTTTITYNADGYRGALLPFERTPGVTRVLVIGDSFVQGIEVEDVDYFRTHLETLLDGQHYEVMAVGRGGWSVVNLYLYWQCQGYRYAPDIVLMHSFSNDVPDTVPYYFQAGNGILATLDWQFENGVITPIQVEPLQSGGVAMDVHAPSDDPYMALAWGRYELYTALLQDAIEASGAQFAVAYSPMQIELDGQTYAYDRFTAIYDRLNITQIDLYGAYQGLDGLFIPDDHHYTALGHQALARALYDWLMC